MQKKPSILFINRVYPPERGATGRLLRDITRAFADDGWDVCVLCSGKGVEKPDLDSAIKIIRCAPLGVSKSMRAYVIMWLRLLKSGLSMPKHDVIVTMTDPPFLVHVGRIVSFFKKSVHVHWLQDMYPDLLSVMNVNAPNWVMRFARKSTLRALKRCNKIMVVGRCMAERLIQQGIKAGNIAVIPNWPDMELLESSKPKPDYRKKARQKKKIARDFDSLIKDENPRFRILYSGNLGRNHPFDTLIDAAEILQEDHDDIEFLFVGDGIQFDSLMQQRTKRNLKNIRFLPHQPASKLRELMESGDIHFITMDEEATGMMVPSKVYPALSVGRPCIFMGPGNSEISRILRDFHAGEVIAHGDVKSLVRVIKNYRKDSDAWHKAHKGAVTAGEVFRPEESIRAFKKRICDIVGVPYKKNR